MMTRHKHCTDTAGTARLRSRGFTLLELLVTLTLAALLLAIGVPSFFDVIRNSRAATNANDLVTALSIARSEAIRRGARVSVCGSADGATCGSSGWQQGWIVFVDTAASDDAAPVLEEVLRVWPAPNGDATVTVGSQWVRFLPRGDARANTSVSLPLTYTLAFEDCSGMQGRRVEVNAVGRTTVERTSCT